MELCRLLDFKDLGDEREKLVVVEGAQDIPFEIKRVFYIYGLTTRLSAESMRTRKANLSLSMLPGNQRCALQTESASMLLSLTARCRENYLPKMVWKDMYDFSPDSVLLALASTHYDGNEYIRDYDEYLKIMGVKK